MTETPSTSTSGTKPKNNLLNLPPEIRHQIYVHAFSNLSLYVFQPHNYLSRDCEQCQRVICTTPLRLYKPHFQALLTSKQLYTEASPLFYDTLTLQASDTFTLDAIRKFTHYPLRKRIRNVSVTVHLNDDTRFAWHHALTTLAPKTFPNLTRLTLQNHMRPPTSYDRLVDAIYIASPLVLSTFPAHLRSPPGLDLSFRYVRDEVMFESPFLGEITTADSIDAHEAVIRDLMNDEGFQRAANANPADDEALNRWEEDGGRIPEFGAGEPGERAGMTTLPPGGTRGDFEEMMARLLAVARGHEERWLESLQRRRLGGLTVREVQERVVRGINTAPRAPGDGGEAGPSDDHTQVEEDRIRTAMERIMAENGWTREDYEMILEMERESQGL